MYNYEDEVKAERNFNRADEYEELMKAEHRMDLVNEIIELTGASQDIAVNLYWLLQKSGL